MHISELKCLKTIVVACFVESCAHIVPEVCCNFREKSVISLLTVWQYKCMRTTTPMIPHGLGFVLLWSRDPWYQKSHTVHPKRSGHLVKLQCCWKRTLLRKDLTIPPTTLSHETKNALSNFQQQESSGGSGLSPSFPLSRPLRTGGTITATYPLNTTVHPKNCFFFFFDHVTDFWPFWRNSAGPDVLPSLPCNRTKTNTFQIVCLTHMSDTQKTKPNQTKKRNKKATCLNASVSSWDQSSDAEKILHRSGETSSVWGDKERPSSLGRWGQIDPISLSSVFYLCVCVCVCVCEDWFWLKIADWIGDGVRLQQPAISATHHLSLTALLHPVGSRLWETPSSHWADELPEGYGEPSRGCSLASAAWGGVGEGRWARTCAQESSALIWCWGWGRADVERWRSRTGTGRSTLRWTSWKQHEERQKKCGNIISAAIIIWSASGAAWWG